MNRHATRSILSLLFVATALTCLACAGGSGSSGFDISSAAESVAIQRALDQNECVVRKELTICPANEGARSTPAATPVVPSATPTPPSAPAQPAIDTNLDHTSSLTCFQVADSLCNLAVQFAPRGFPSGAQFFVAVRSSEEGASWRIDPQLARDAGNGSLEAPVDVPVQGLELQVAILVFDTVPPSLPSEVVELADSGASFAYVTHVLMLSPI